MNWHDIESIAVIGASDTPQSPGAVITANVLASTVPTIILVNPHHTELYGHVCVAHLSQPAQLAIIVVPAPVVLATMHECIAQGTTTFVIISAGFAEEHSVYSDALDALIATHSLTVLGPNCLGFLSSAQRLNATFADLPFAPGPLSIASQSGAFIVAASQYLAAESVGIDLCFSLGNEQGMTESDVLQVCSRSSQTRTILLYLENISDGQAFATIARTLIEQNIHIILLKGGATAAGQTAAASHTAAMATDSALFDALCRWAGIVRATSMEQAFLLAAQYSRDEVVEIRPTLLITNAGGVGTVTADILDSNHIPLTLLSDSASISKNPLDVRGDASPTEYTRAITLAAQEGWAQIILIYTMQGKTLPADFVDLAIAAQAQYPAIRLLTYTLGGTATTDLKRILRAAGIRSLDSVVCQPPSYTTVDERIFELPQPSPAHPSTDLVPEQTVYQLVSTLGAGNIAVGTKHFYTAGDGAHDWDMFPAVVKLSYPQFIHKSDLHTVYTNLKTNQEIQTAVQKLRTIIDISYPEYTDQMQYTVEQQIPIDHELFVGIHRDTFLGDFIVVGLGGIYANIVSQPCIIPLGASESEFCSLLSQSPVARLAAGFRGAAGFALTDLYALGQFFRTYLGQYPTTKNIDVNPVIVSSGRLYLADVKIVQGK